MSNFDIKSQKILGGPEPTSGRWSIPFEYEPEEADVLSKRGKLYIVVDFFTQKDVDLHLASKIVIDAIKEHFYSELEGTPLQALESAVSYGKDKLQTTASTNNGVEIKFDIVACVVWGNILYLAQVGETTSLIIRNGEVSDVSHKTSGEIMTTSGILENEDVVILSTKKFEEEFPVSDLVPKLASLDTLISGSPNNISLSTVIISFKKSMVPSAKDLASFVTPFRGKKNEQAKNAVDIATKPKATDLADKTNSSTPPKDLTNSSPVTSINVSDSKNTITIQTNLKQDFKKSSESKDFELKPPSRKGRKAKKLFGSVAVLALVLGLSYGVFALYKNLTGQGNNSDIAVVVNETYEDKFELLNKSNAVLEDYQKLREEVKNEVESGALEYYDLLSQIDKKIEELGGATASEPVENEDAFYNFIVKSDSSNINKVSLLGNSILVSDLGASTAYLLTEGEEVSINDIAGSDNYLISVSDGQNIYVIEKDKLFVGTTPENLTEVALSTNLEGVKDAFVYFGNIYVLTDNAVLKLEENSDEYTVTTWAEVGSGFNSISVDGSIYLGGSNKVEEYYTGEKQDFSLSGAQDLSDVVSSTNANTNTLYLFSNGAFYEFNKQTGELINEYQFDNLPSEASSILINNSNLYLTNRSSLYKYSLSSSENQEDSTLEVQDIVENEADTSQGTEENSTQNEEAQQ